MQEAILELAINEAWKFQGCTLPNPAVGAVLLGKHGEIIAIAAHKCAGEAHAEVLALRDGLKALKNIECLSNNPFEIHRFILENHSNIFKECSLLVTLEPCSHSGKTPSCALLLAELGLKRVIIGHQDNTLQARGGAEILKKSGIMVQFIQNTLTEKLLYPFICLQNNKKFIFFKYAQRLDGSIDQGIISSQNSRNITHYFRGAIDLLVISGKSVRIDNPLLDTRFANHLAPPDVLIITNNKNSIACNSALFSVKGRKVHFAHSPSILKEIASIGDYKTIMIEGGANFFEGVEQYLDMIAIFIAPQHNKNGRIRICFKEKWNIWHTQQITGNDDNILIWLGK